MLDQGKPTTRQIIFVQSLKRQLHMSDRQLSIHCQEVYGAPFMRLSREQMSALIDELLAWKELPANLQRAAGQQDLPGLEP